MCTKWFHVWISRNNQQDALCNRNYYSKIYWRLNMFQAAFRSSSGASNCICSLLFIYTCGDRPLSRLGGNCGSHQAWRTAAVAEPSQRPSTINVCKTKGCNYSFWAPDDGRCVARTCWAIKKHRNNKFYYTVASCWFFLRDLAFRDLYIWIQRPEMVQLFGSVVRWLIQTVYKRVLW